MVEVDIACGKEKKKGCIGIDISKNSSADIIATALHIPFKDCSVDKINCSHFVEHLFPDEAQMFFDEIFRVLKDGKKANLKVDRDWTKKRLFRKDNTHKHRYKASEIEGMVKGFQSRKVEGKIYRFGYHLRTKIFIELVK